MLGGTRGKALEDGCCALQLYGDQGRAADTGPLCKSSVALPRQGAGRGDAASGHFVKDLCAASAGFLLIRGSQPRSSAPLPCPPPAPLPLRGVLLQLPGTAVGLHCPAWDTRRGLKKCGFFWQTVIVGAKSRTPGAEGLPVEVAMPLQPQPFTSTARLLPAGKAGHGEELGWEWPRGSVTCGPHPRARGHQRRGSACVAGGRPDEAAAELLE